MTEPRKFAYFGYDRSEKEFKELQVFCYTDGEAKAIIEDNNIAFLHGGFIDDKHSLGEFISAPMYIHGALHKFFEKRKNPNWPL